MKANQFDKAEFKKAYIELCQRHNLCIVPLFEGKPSAHESLAVIPLDPFWEKHNQGVWDDYEEDGES